jgi:hypothetical protein
MRIVLVVEESAGVQTLQLVHPSAHVLAAVLTSTEIAVPRLAATGQETAEPAGTVGDRDGDGVRVATGDEWVVMRRVLVDGVSAAPHEVLCAGDRLDAHPDRRAR